MNTFSKENIYFFIIQVVHYSSDGGGGLSDVSSFVL